MARLKIFFNNGLVCEIDVLENKFTENFLKTVENSKNNQKRFSRIGNYRLEGHHWEEKKAIQLVDNINQTVDKLKQDYDFEFPGKAYYGMGHPKCNELHRYFTHCLRGFPSKVPIYLWENDYERWISYKRNKDFELIKSYFNEKVLQTHYEEEIWHNDIIPLLENINMRIHDYESLIKNKTKEYAYRDLDPVEYSYIEIGLRDLNDIPGEDCYEFCSFENYDVTLLKSICGKDYWQCFMDEDDPRFIDIVNVSDEYESGVSIEPFSPRQNFWKETNFQWFKHYNIPIEKEIIAPMPIGNIINDFSYVDFIKGRNGLRKDISINDIQVSY